MYNLHDPSYVSDYGAADFNSKWALKDIHQKRWKRMKVRRQMNERSIWNCPPKTHKNCMWIFFLYSFFLFSFLSFLATRKNGSRFVEQEFFFVVNVWEEEWKSWENRCEEKFSLELNIILWIVQCNNNKNFPHFYSAMNAGKGNHFESSFKGAEFNMSKNIRTHLSCW